MSIKYDMHSHLDFASNCKEVAAESAGKIITVNSTVEPAAFVSAKEKFADFDDVHVAIGIHPWWVANGRISEVDLAHFENLLPTTNLVGEVGLDFYKSRKNSMQFQIEVFERLLSDIANAEEPKLVFLHGVKAYETLLNMLEKSGALKKSTFVFHWFSGTHEDFGRALSMGCYFSVGMRMLAQDNGLLFAKAIPDELLLAETDNPPEEGMEWSGGQWQQEIDNTYLSLAEARGVEVAEIDRLLKENSTKLLQNFNMADAVI